MDKIFLASFVCLLSFVFLSIIIYNETYTIFTGLLKTDNFYFLQLKQLSLFLPSFVDNIMLMITLYGREIFWPIVLIMLFIFGGKIGKKTAVIAAISMLLLMPLVSVIKDVIDRPRPNVSGVETFPVSADTFSFPSGHATIVSAGLATVSIMFRGNMKRTVLFVGLTFEAALVCFSRIYVGVHYPLDVVGGILLGTGFSFLLVGLTQSFLFKTKFVEN
ncbi:MAG: phosphatase PAP2 family protein [Nitrososphaerales archaeon]